MTIIAIDYKLAHAAGTDAANRNMRREGRTVWSEADYDMARVTFEKLMPDSFNQHQTTETE